MRFSIAKQASLRLIDSRTTGSSQRMPPEVPVTSGAALDGDFSRTLAALGGLAARSRIHAVHPARPGDEGSATGFAFTVLGHLAAAAGRSQRNPRHPRPILWVQDRRARLEAGLPYALGLHRLGIDPAQLVIISTRMALDALSATEMGLETGGLDGVLAELHVNLPADMLALGKRLVLRAERTATPCLLLHASAVPVPAPVATRWQVASRSAVTHGPWGGSIPTVDLTLSKNRFGSTGRWSAVLKPACSLGISDVRLSHLPPPLSQPVDAAAVHGPSQATARFNAA